MFDPVSERIIRLRLELHTGFVSFTVVYFPTNQSKNESETREFL